MKKNIILKNGAVKLMTYEEVVKQFEPLMNRFVNTAISKFGDKIDREEMLQEMRIETWRAFEIYDEVHAFSTILYNKLKKVTGNKAQNITAKKRKSSGVLSMNASINETDDLTIEDLIASEDFTAESMIAKEMMDVILPKLNDREKEELTCLLYPHEFSKTRLAEKRGISRPAAGQRVKKTKEKIQQILIDHEFVMA